MIPANQKRRQSGFSILELIIAIAAIGILSIILSQIFFTTLRSNTKSERLKEVKQNGELSLEQIIRMVQNAKGVSSACSPAGETSDTLSFINPDNGETTLGCSWDGSVLRIASSSASYTDYLTSSVVTLGAVDCSGSSLRFVCFGGAGIPSRISVSFRLAQAGTPHDVFEKASADFQTTINVRNILYE